MRDSLVALRVVVACFAAGTASAQDNDATTGARETRDPGNAMVVRRLTPQELDTAVDRYASRQSCGNRALRARTDGSSFWIDGSAFTFDGFADELVRRYEARPFHCVDIRGPGYDARRVSKLLGRVRNATGIDSINWVPAASK
jgi:hypothetical protein